MSNPESTPNRIDLKSHQDEIRKQIESNTVVLYNLKDNNAFYAITPEEARFAIDAIKKRRENTHYAQIVPLKEQDHYKKHKETYSKRDGVVLFTQNVSNLQLATKDYYAETYVGFRGGIAHESDSGTIFDIAVNPSKFDHSELGVHVKKGYLSILREKLLNDLETYRCMIDKLFSDGKISKEQRDLSKIEQYEVAIKILYGGTRGHLLDSEWEKLSKEERMGIIERMMKEDQKEYEEIERMVKGIIVNITQEKVKADVNK